MTPERSKEGHVGMTYVRNVTADKLRRLDAVCVIHDRSEPVAVLVPMGTFLEWQKLLGEPQR